MISSLRLPRIRRQPSRYFCELDRWSFDARYTNGRCPICGWAPAGAPTAPGWLMAGRRMDWQVLGLLALAIMLLLVWLIVDLSVCFYPPTVHGHLPRTDAQVCLLSHATLRVYGVRANILRSIWSSCTASLMHGSSVDRRAPPSSGRCWPNPAFQPWHGRGSASGSTWSGSRHRERGSEGWRISTAWPTTGSAPAKPPRPRAWS